MTSNLIHMVNNLNASTDDRSLNYVLLGRPHQLNNSNHPTYLEMIQGAISAMNNGKQNNKAAILKYITQNYHIGENLPMVNTELRQILEKTSGANLEEMREHSSAAVTLKMISGREKMPLMIMNKKGDDDIIKESTKNQKKRGRGGSGGAATTTAAKKKTMGKKRRMMSNKNSAMPRVRKSTGATTPKSTKKKTEKTMKPTPSPATTTMTLRAGTRKKYN